MSKIKSIKVVVVDYEPGLWNGLEIFRMSANSKLFSKYIITAILVSLEMSLPINHYSVFVLFVSSFQLEFYPSDYSSLINKGSLAVFWAKALIK